MGEKKMMKKPSVKGQPITYVTIDTWQPARNNGAVSDENSVKSSNGPLKQKKKKIATAKVQ